MRGKITAAALAALALLAGVALAQPPVQGVPASRVKVQAFGQDLEALIGSGRLDPQDTDGDGLFERARLWDADGDGSPGLVACTGQRDPYPQCKTAGELLYLDGFDDLNCAIHGCGFGQMELTGTIELPEAVVVGFGCWDVGAWLADSSIVADPVANCPAAGINDPRGICQPGGKTGSGTRWDSSVGDADVYADCPLDPDGYPLVTLSTLDWQGKIVGAGRDGRKNDAAIMQARGEGRVRGTTLAIDTGNEDIPWFNAGVGFVRGLQFGRDIGGGGGSVPAFNNGGRAIGTGDSKGWGQVKDFGNRAMWAGVPGSQGSLCVCNSSVDCDNNSGLASATGWISDLVDGDRLVVTVYTNPQNTIYMPIEIRVRGDGDTFGAGGCGGDGYLQMPIGGAANGDFRAPQLPWGIFHSTYSSFVGHPRSSSWENRPTLLDVTVEAQDFYAEAGGNCTRTILYAPGGDGSPRDHDCDTHPTFAMLGLGENVVERMTLKNWHHFGVDGGPNPGKTYMRDTEFLYGHGLAFTDDSYSWEWERVRIAHTLFTGQPFGAFFSYTSYRDLEFEDVRTGPLFHLGVGAHGLRVDGVTAIDTIYSSAIRLDCGARNNVFRNFDLYGNKRSFEGQNTGLIELNCPSEWSETVACNTAGQLQDRGAGATDYHCDVAIQDNVFENIVTHANVGMPPIFNRFTSVDAGTDRFTLETAEDLGDCTGPYFVHLTGISCPSDPCQGNFYAVAPSYITGTTQFSTSPVCSSVVDVTVGGTPTTSQMSAANPYATLGVKFVGADGHERAFVRNIFDKVRIFGAQPIDDCRSPGVNCLVGNPLNSLVAVSNVGSGSTNIEEVLAYNVVNNSYVDDGVLVGQCAGTNSDCSDVRQLSSALGLRGSGNFVGGRMGVRSEGQGYQGRLSEIIFCGDLPTGTDSTWWLPPIHTQHSTVAAADDRSSRRHSPFYCAAALGVDENTAIATVSEPVNGTGDPTMVAAAMSCYTTGDVAGDLTFTFNAGDASPTGLTCTITAGSEFEDYCSIAIAVADGAVPTTTIAANAQLSVTVNNASGDQSANDAYCVVYARPRL